MRARTSGVGRSAPTRRAAVVAVVAAIVATGLVVVGAATAGPAAAVDPAKTIPTLPPTSVPDESTLPGPTTTADQPTSEPVGSVEPLETPPPSIDTGIDLHAGARLAEIAAVAGRVLDDTDDVVSEIDAFATMPTGIATPAGASITALRVTYYAASDDSYFTADVTFTTSATPEDLVIFYQATLAATTLEPAGDETAEDADGFAVRELSYDNPDSEYPDASVVVTITDADNRSDDSVAISITDHLDEATIHALAGWAAGLPQLEIGQPVEATVLAATAPNSSLDLGLSTVYRFDDVEPGQLHDTFVRELPRPGFSLDSSHPEEVDGDRTTLFLRHDFLHDLSATFAAAPDGQTTMTVTGTATI